MFVPLPLLALPAGHFADRYPRRTILALSAGLDALVAVGLLARDAAGADATWPFFALAFGTGVASGVGAPAGRALTPSLVPRGDARARVRPALRRVPALGDRRPGARRPALRDPAGARLRRLDGVLAARGRRGAGAAGGPRGRGTGSPTSASLLGGVSARQADARPVRRDLARSLRRPLRRRGRAPAGLREGRARGRPGGPRRSARGAGGRGARRGGRAVRRPITGRPDGRC